MIIHMMPEKNNDSYFRDDYLTKNDVMAAVAVGIVGSVISTNKKLKVFLHSIHDDSSLYKPKKLLGKMLHHSGDHNDCISRGGRPFSTYLHRLYGGHDILSLQGDNPFAILCKQYGIPKGIVQSVRHLLADTFSKNGGVLPGSSFFDFRREDGNIGNYIDEWSKKMGRLIKLSSQEVYAELFSIKIQDIGSVAVIKILLKGYEKAMVVSKIRKDYSKIASSQLRIIALFTAALASFGLGAIQHKGIGKVNIPVFFALAHETTRLLCLNKKDIKMISERNDSLETRLAILEQSVMKTV